MTEARLSAIRRNLAKGRAALRKNRGPTDIPATMVEEVVHLGRETDFDVLASLIVAVASKLRESR